MNGLDRARRRAGDERGFTITEMLVVLLILGAVLSALIAVFVSALRTEVDQNNRFEAQQNARMALDRLRREIHCGQTANVAAGGDAVTLHPGSTAATGYCHAGDTTWCAVPAVTGFSLYRQLGATCDASGTLIADYLTSNQIFAPIYAAGSRTKLRVDLRVDRDPSDSRQAYRLFDEIVLRGSERQ